MGFHDWLGYVGRLVRARGDAPPVSPLVDDAFADARRRWPAIWAADSRNEPARQAKFECLCLCLAETMAPLDVKMQQRVLEEVVDRLDIGLREAGVGDMTVGKEVRAYAGALHGRLLAYMPLIKNEKFDEIKAVAARHGVVWPDTPAPRAPRSRPSR